MKDVQNEKDTRKVNLDFVGVKNVIIPLKVKDKTKTEQHVQANVSAFVSLEKTQKGIHMSHIIDHLFNLTKRYGLNQIVNVAQMIQQAQTQENKNCKTNACNLILKFKYFIDKKAPVSKVASVMAYDVEVNTTVGKYVNIKRISVKVPVSTCCPCSLELCDNKAAHNQRGYITISTYQNISDSKIIWFEDLIEIAESSGSCEIYPVLRRPDEKYVTEKMFQNAKFVEDCVRDAVVKMKKKYGKMKFKVSCENVESIHNHSAYAETEVI